MDEVEKSVSNDFEIGESTSETKTSAKKRKTISKSTPRKQAKTNEFEVEQLLAHKNSDSVQEYLVRWKNFDEKYDSWALESQLNCPRILKAYKKKHNIP